MKTHWRRWLRLIIRGAAIAFCILLAAIVARGWYAFRDRHPNAAFAIRLTDETWQRDPRPLRVGFGKVKITPYRDKYDDAARPIYLAGFGQNRLATGVRDDLWALACVIDDGHRRVGIASLDAIGMFHESVLEIRRRLPPDHNIDYTVVCTTHNHSTPDLMGLWGPHPLKSGVDPEYLEQVIAGTVQALSAAVSNLEPAEVAFHEIPLATEGLLTDTRKPIVYDPDLRLMHFLRPSDRTTIGTVITWANHPETPWSQNTEITSDFCGFLRQALHDGVELNGQTMIPALGGTHLYINGAVGGLMTTHPSITVTNPFTGVALAEPSHEKSQALGWHLAKHIAPLLTKPATATPHAPITIQAHTLEIPLNNWGFLLAPTLGLIDRGHSSWMKMRSEIALLTFGDASIACVPGEIYPEIINGGVENAPGGDYACAPVEIPPWRELMPGRVKFVFGLANDEIGYIIPKSQWDRKPPYLYDSVKGVYGEINSVGPECAPTLHLAFKALAANLQP